MREQDPRKVIDEAPGLAGGPPPAPPGVGDNTPQPAPAAPEAPLPGRELQGDGMLTPQEEGTPGGVPRGG